MINETAGVEEVIRGFWEFAPSGFTSGLDLLFNLATIAGALFIIYLVFLIIRSLFRARAMKDLRIAMKNIVEINDKLDRITNLLEKHHDKKSVKKEEKKKKKKFFKSRK